MVTSELTARISHAWVDLIFDAVIRTRLKVTTGASKTVTPYLTIPE